MLDIDPKQAISCIIFFVIRNKYVDFRSLQIGFKENSAFLGMENTKTTEKKRKTNNLHK